MTRMISRAVAALVLTAALYAHGGLEHVTGFVKAIAADSVTVETVKHETVVVMLTPQTEVLKSGAKAVIGDLKVGDRVAIHAEKTKDGKLQAHEVSFGPAASAPAH